MYTMITVYLNDSEEKTDLLVTRQIPYLPYTSIILSVSITYIESLVLGNLLCFDIF